MPSYKLVYFNVRGVAEPIRMMLAYVGQEFEDVRYTQDEWITKHKADAPMQQLPYLEIDGQRIPQSRAILGFLARKYCLNGTNNEETTTIDVVIASLEDLARPLAMTVYHEKDEGKKKEQLAAYYAEKAPTFLEALEGILKSNESGDGFFVGSKISRADIIFYVIIDMFNNDEVLKNYPKLFALRERIAKDPKIAAYLEKRPKTI